MSMHLEGPWLSTTGKKKGKQKFRSAIHKSLAQDLDASWQELNNKYQAAPVRKVARKVYTAPINPNMQRSSRDIPSVDSGKGSATLPPVKQYTGDKMIGIGTMHKSNMVPIFSDQEAKDISTMRRG